MPLTLPTTILGKPALFIEPNGVPRNRIAQVRGNSGSFKHGSKTVHTQSAIPVERREFEFFCTTHAELEALEDFWTARQGRLEPFFMPTWQYEFDTFGLVPDGLGSHWLKIRKFGYLEEVLPKSPMYRYIMIIKADTYYIFSAFREDESNSNTDADFEYIAYGSAGGSSDNIVSVQPNRPLWLRFVRFDTDEFRAEYQTNGVAKVSLPVMEVPLECP